MNDDDLMDEDGLSYALSGDASLERKMDMESQYYFPPFLCRNEELLHGGCVPKDYNKGNISADHTITTGGCGELDQAPPVDAGASEIDWSRLTRKV